MRLVSALLDRHLPINSRDLHAGSRDFIDHRQLVDALLAAFVQCGSLRLLAAMFRILREGDAHTMSGEVMSSLATCAAGIVHEGAGAENFVAHCLRLVLDTSTDCNARRVVKDHLLFPVLQRLAPSTLCTVATSTAFADKCRPHVAGTSLLHSIVSVVPSSKDASMPGTEEARFQLAWALGTIACLYETLPLDTIKGQLTRAWKGTDSVKGNELTTHLCKHGKWVYARAVSDAAPGRLDLCRSAWLCISSVVCKTQTKLKFYEAFLFKEEPWSGVYLWDNLVDRDAVFDFEVETKFDFVKVQLAKLQPAVPRLSRGSLVGCRLLLLWKSVRHAQTLSWRVQHKSMACRRPSCKTPSCTPPPRCSVEAATNCCKGRVCRPAECLCLCLPKCCKTEWRLCRLIPLKLVWTRLTTKTTM